MNTRGIDFWVRHAWKYIAILQQYQLRQLVESAIFDDIAPEWMASVPKSIQSFEVINKSGVAYRASPHFLDRIPSLDGNGPSFGTKFKGRLVTGLDQAE